jgi:starch phosphorylase
MRILLDEYELSWDDAWDITQGTLSYTNHTVMSEALEKWREDMYQRELPRIYQITAEINRRLMGELRNIYPSDRAKLDYMAVISGGEVRMANLCLAACRKINGVSSLHSQILKESIFRDYNTVSPEKFTNVTNGIAYRRWLCQANPLLSDYIESLIGSGFKNDASVLTELMRFKGNKEVLSRLYDIKRQNKERLCSYILSANGIKADPSSVFDVQVKRLHEYKRQLLNVLGILHMYRELKDNPNMDFTPRTFVFAAKASAGYFMAKEIIRLICAVANVINSDRAMQDKLKVVFLEDYKVSLAEIIIPAAEISEQISVAGKEASGTGNMKLMINGAVTLGTLDGANVEIRQCAGEENMFLFGMNADEVNNLWRQGYYPTSYVNANPRLKAVLDMLTSGVLGSRFDTILNSLLASSGGTADAYMALADFESYVNIQKKAGSVYLDKYKFTDMSLANIANAGFFSSDRAIREYAEGIWNIKL